MNENEIIKKLEQKFDTSKFKTDKFWFYPILKIFIYFELTYSKIKNNTNRFSVIKTIFSAFFKSFFNKKNKKIDILTISSAHYIRKKDGDKIENTFFYFLKNLFSDKKIINYINLDNTNLKIKNIKDKNIYIADFSIYKFLLFSKLRKKQNIVYDKDLVKQYIKHSGLNINSSIIEDKFNKFNIYVHFFIKYLKKTKPKIVIMLWHYNFWNFALTYACKNLKIPVVEFQHGIVSKHHLAYIYEKVNNRDLFPDYLFTFGDFFTNEIKANSDVFKPENIKSVGLPFLEEKIKAKFNPTGELANFIKDDKIIVVMSQKTIRIELQKFILELSKSLPKNYKILYKTHPTETDYSKFYKSFKNIKNIYLLANSKYNSLDLIKIADIHTTVHSTTVFEAIALRKISILIYNNKYNYEFDKHIDNQIIWRVKTVSEFIFKIKEIESKKLATQIKISSEKYYKTDSINNIRAEIENICKKKYEI